MDYRLCALLHLPLGLKVQSIDIEKLLAPELDPNSKEQVVASLSSIEAKIYLEKHPDWPEISRAILVTSERHGIRWLHLGHENYPQSWSALSYRPAIFSYQGEPAWLECEFISVVGSRTPATDTLLWMQRELSAFLVGRKVGVVSGGARGVDQWAHRMALDCGRPTICILPSGLLNPYPFGRENLWRQIRDNGGCMISTCALEEPLRKSFFHIRNRWIAGLAPLCFVAEANRRSGSQLTAKLAFEEHKTVCTLPVFPTATQGLGNLDLIADGAIFLRDHLDLQVLWDQVARPRFALKY